MKDSEPVLVASSASALLLLFQAFGGNLTDAKTHAIIGAVSALAALVFAVWARSKVTPTKGGGS